MVVTRWAKNDYDVYFPDDDCSVRGTFADIIDEIIGEKYDRL